LGYGTLIEHVRHPPTAEVYDDDELKPQPQFEKLRFKGDRYTPRYVRGTGPRREGWCSTCPGGSWHRLKVSDFFSRSISATRGFSTRETQALGAPILGIKSHCVSTTFGVDQADQTSNSSLASQNSAFNFHQLHSHGISSATGQRFAAPLDLRLVTKNNKSSRVEGFCGKCEEWVVIVIGKRRPAWGGWFHHSHACALNSNLGESGSAGEEKKRRKRKGEIGVEEEEEVESGKETDGWRGKRIRED